MKNNFRGIKRSGINTMLNFGSNNTSSLQSSTQMINPDAFSIKPNKYV